MAFAVTSKHTFPRGVHPPEKKALTNDSKIQPGPAAKLVSVLLSQHIGAVCRTLVKKGDVVEMGQKIGDCDAFVSAPVHSPVKGKVKEVSLRSHAILGRGEAITIEAVEESSAKGPEFKVPADFDVNKYSGEQICEASRAGGLVGMGGAGFPTRVKLEPNPQMPKDDLIVNGCECEPYITCDYRIMLEWTDRIIAGVKLAKKASECSRAFVGIEDNKPQAIDAMTSALKGSGGSDQIEVVAVKTKYPQGGERQLIQAVLNKKVPAGSIPPMIGVLVLNVATAAALAEAVISDVPLTHRVVTVTGEPIVRPGNYYVPVGTSVGDLIEFCGGVTQSAAKVILGGPMTGIAVADLETPTTKTTNAVTVLTKEQIGKAKFDRRVTPCIRCGRCLAVCPENLNPTKIAHAIKHDRLDIAERYDMAACIECGCCSYICPANIELTGYIKTGKIFVARQKKKMA
jgi:electron transport complex protein RnfC